MQKLRYRLYREHKFVSAQLSDLERFIATLDFTNPKELMELKMRLQGTFSLMEGHARHEDESIHPLLKARGSKVFEHIEEEHRDYQFLHAKLDKMLTQIEFSKDKNEQIDLGYKFYLAYRHFLAINLNHINEEENILMPEIQRLYSDEEIKKAVDFPVYAIMTSDDIYEMVSLLFPAMNIDDKEAFLRDIQVSQPKKFIELWGRIAGEIDINEKNKLIKTLRLNSFKYDG